MLNAMPGKPKSITDLGLDIKVHLCKFCVHQTLECRELQYAYGSGEGERDGMPNICACDGFDPNIVSRQDSTVTRKALRQFIDY